MQHQIRWQVEAVKSSATGVVSGFRIVTLKWQREAEDFSWRRSSADEFGLEYDIYSQSLNDLSKKEYMQLLKLNFVKACYAMNKTASIWEYFPCNKTILHKQVGLNWIEYQYKFKEDLNGLDRQNGNENRVSNDSEITREC